jgi:RNA polymerase sigma factor (sigma-70 family)
MDETHPERTRRFDALFRTYSPDIIAYCGWRSDSAGESDDAVAEVFLTAWRRLEDVPEGSAARVWLYATARRVIANQRRSRRRRLALRDRLSRERTDVVVEMFPTGSNDWVVHETLRRLRPGDREVLLLAEWERLTPAEIGAVLGCLTVTARGRLHRARFRFRVLFEELEAGGNDEEAELARARVGSSHHEARARHGRTSVEKEDDHVDFEHVRSASARQPAL